MLLAWLATLAFAFESPLGKWDLVLRSLIGKKKYSYIHVILVSPLANLMQQLVTKLYVTAKTMVGSSNFLTFLLQNGFKNSIVRGQFQLGPYKLWLMVVTCEKNRDVITGHTLWKMRINKVNYVSIELHNAYEKATSFDTVLVRDIY